MVMAGILGIDLGAGIAAGAILGLGMIIVLPKIFM
jgi:hypothetical protein